MAIALYGGFLIDRIINGFVAYDHVIEIITGSAPTVIALSAATIGLFFIELICYTVLMRRFLYSSLRYENKLLDDEYLKISRFFIYAIPFIVILYVCILRPVVIPDFFRCIFSQCATIYRFISFHLEGILLGLIILILLRWIIDRRHITRIEEFSILQPDGKKEDASDLDDAVRNEIGRIKGLYFDPGAFREIESLAQGDFRMFRMMDDPMVAYLSTVTGSVNAGSILSFFTGIFTNLMSLFIFAPRISGKLSIQNDSWLMYATYQDGWKSYSWRVTQKDLQEVFRCFKHSPKNEPVGDSKSNVNQTVPVKKRTLLCDTNGFKKPFCCALFQFFQKNKASEESKPVVPEKVTTVTINHALVAEVLTARILINLSQPGTPRWEALVWYNRGLQMYRRALREGNDRKKKETHLKRSFSNFLTAVSFDEAYALAYYNMGLVLHEYLSKHKEKKSWHTLVLFLFWKSLSCNPALWYAKYAQMIANFRYILNEPESKIRPTILDVIVNELKDEGFFTVEDFDMESNNQNPETLMTILTTIYHGVPEHSKSDSSCDWTNIVKWKDILNNCADLIHEIPENPAIYLWKGFLEYQIFKQSWCTPGMDREDIKTTLREMKVALQTANNLYEKHYIRLGLSTDFYTKFRDDELMYRSCIKNTNLLLAICQYLLKIMENPYNSDKQKDTIINLLDELKNSNTQEEPKIHDFQCRLHKLKYLDQELLNNLNELIKSKEQKDIQIKMSQMETVINELEESNKYTCSIKIKNIRDDKYYKKARSLALEMSDHIFEEAVTSFLDGFGIDSTHCKKLRIIRLSYTYLR